MTYWKLYRSRKTSVPQRTWIRQLRHDPTVVAVEFDFDDQTLDRVSDEVGDSLRPVVVTTTGFLGLIDLATDTGLILRDLEFSHELSSEEAWETSEAIHEVRQGRGLVRLRELLLRLANTKGLVVKRVAFWIEPPASQDRVRFSVYNNGIISSSGDGDVLNAADLPLSALGGAVWGRVHP